MPEMLEGIPDSSFKHNSNVERDHNDSNGVLLDCTHDNLRCCGIVGDNGSGPFGDGLGTVLFGMVVAYRTDFT